MKGNMTTIIKKEFARFFGDRQLLFSTVVLPGLLIYIVYSLMGSGISQMVTQGQDKVVELWVENMPPSLVPTMNDAPGNLQVTERAFAQSDVEGLADKDVNAVLVRFPSNFDEQIADGKGEGGVPNVEIYYNSANNASARAYGELSTMLERRYSTFTVNEPQFEGQRYDQVSGDAIGAMVWSKLLPMLIVMMLFSGVMSIAPSSIAGEKERGTIATLLVTPMKRSELALGKVVSLSCLALLSGVSSFVGIALSLPKMMNAEEEINMEVHYALGDYVALLLVIFSTVLVLVSVVSLLSTLAKDVKNAGTMTTPLMLLLMLTGLLPMLRGETEVAGTLFLVPFYNAIETMTAVFAHEVQWWQVLTTVVSNVAYTGVAVWGLTKLFNSERVMFRR